MTATCTIDQELNLDTTKLKLEDTTTQAERLLRTLQHMRREEELTDVTLEVDGHSFPCHRNVLAANSPYFSAMFAGGLAEARQDRVTISGISHDVMGLILDYFYTGMLDVSEDRVQELCAAACLHQCDEIREKCSEFMKTKVCESNCVAMFAFSDAHSMEDLKCWSEKYVKQYFKNVCGTSEFLQLPLCQLVELLSLDGLYVDEEETVLDTAKNWMKESPERQQFGSEILKCIRLPYLGEDALKSVKECLHVHQEEVDLQLKEQMQRKRDTRGREVSEKELAGKADKGSYAPDQNTSHSEENVKQNQASLGTDEVTGGKISGLLACLPRAGMRFKEMIIFQTSLVDYEHSHGFPAFEPQSGKVYKLLSQRIVESTYNDNDIIVIHSMVSTPTCDLCALSYLEPKDHHHVHCMHCLVHSKHQEQEWRYHGEPLRDQNFNLRYCALEYFNEHVYTLSLRVPGESSGTCHWMWRISVRDMIGREIEEPWLCWDNHVMQVPSQRVGVLTACGDRLYFMGDSIFYTCDPETQTLTTLPPPPDPFNKLDERLVLTAYKGSLYFLKYRTTTDYLPMLQIFDPSEGKWHVGPRLPLPANKVKLFFLLVQLVVYQRQLILVVGSRKFSTTSSAQEVVQLSFFKYGVRCWELSDIDPPPIGKYLANETLPFGTKCIVAKLTPESLESGDRFMD